MKRIFYILILAFLLTACGKQNTQEPTVATDPTTAPATAPTIAPTSAPIVAPTAPAISEEESFQKLIKDNWWYWRAIGCDFEKPEDVSLQHYFYMGCERIPSGTYAPLTDAQKIAIDAAYKNKFGKDPYTGESRLPAAEVKKGLSVLGVSIEDVKIPDDWIYDAETDSYYFWRSDAYGLENWTVTEVEKSPDGIVKVYWESSTIWNSQANRFYPKGTKMVMTMQEKSDGSYLVLSNVPVEPLGPVTADDFTQFIKDEYWYYRALGCTFEKPEDIPAEFFFFYGGLSAEEVNAYYITITPEEQTYIDDVYRQKNGQDPYTGATKLPVPAMNNALSILGVTVEDIEIPSDWVYYDKTNAYYFWVSDAYGVVGWNITQVEKTADGTVLLYWESPDAWNTQTDKAYPRDTKMVMTLKEQSGGNYIILSNVPVE